jgi:hypothetical protein
VSVGLAAVSLVVAAAWMAWSVGQGTNQFIQPGWWAFRYTALLLVALVLALSAVVSVRIRPPANRTVALAVGVVAGLEGLLFGFVWIALVLQPFPG